MKKTLVIYFSRTGNNKYLAQRFARRLAGDLEEIRPKMNQFFLMVIGSNLKMSLGVKDLKHNPAEYDRMIICGPIWTGRLISPLVGAIKKYKTTVPELYFATCCGSKDEMKDDKFGYNHVFAVAKEKAGDILKGCEAFPITLVVPEDKLEDDEYIMNARLSSENFKGEIERRFEAFIASMDQVEQPELVVAE